MANGRTISDADRRLVAQMRANKDAQMRANEGGRTISDADRRRARKKFRSSVLESGRIGSGSRGHPNTISNKDAAAIVEALALEDAAALEESYLRRNDGGIARKTRTF